MLQGLFSLSDFYCVGVTVRFFEPDSNKGFGWNKTNKFW